MTLVESTYALRHTHRNAGIAHLRHDDVAFAILRRIERQRRRQVLHQLTHDPFRDRPLDAPAGGAPVSARHLGGCVQPAAPDASLPPVLLEIRGGRPRAGGGSHSSGLPTPAGDLDASTVGVASPPPTLRPRPALSASPWAVQDGQGLPPAGATTTNEQAPAPLQRPGA